MTKMRQKETTMIDLSYHKKEEPKDEWDSEEIACAIIACILWTVILVGMMAA